MDVDKRYCQNRQRKRKRTVAPTPVATKNVSPAEEERQYKITRFAEDLEKFLSEKENSSKKENITSSKTQLKLLKTDKKVSAPKQKTKRGLFQNGMQTKFYTRGVPGVTTREMTARLNEDLHKIISLASDNPCDNRCQCTHYCKEKIEQKTVLEPPPWQREPRRSSALESLRSRSSPSCEDLRFSPKLPHSGDGREVRREVTATQVVPRSGKSLTEVPRSGKSLTELDKELYPLIVRVVSVSCTKTKSALFKNQSYVSALKRKLLDIFTIGMKGNRTTSCSSEPHKSTSSVGTSPHASSTKTKSSYEKKGTTFKFAPVQDKTHFKSTMHFLEETIGPSSTCSSKNVVPSPQYYQSLAQDCKPHVQCRKPLHSLLSPPVVGYQRHRHVSSYVHEPFLPSSPSVMPLFNLKSKVFDGGGDGFRFNHLNSFLPPVEEEEENSPDFRYYPRKIF